MTALGLNRSEEMYRLLVEYVRETIPRRGRLWEAARPAFESGSYNDPELARLLRDGVIVPATDGKGGHVLPPVTP